VPRRVVDGGASWFIVCSFFKGGAPGSRLSAKLSPSSGWTIPCDGLQQSLVSGPTTAAMIQALVPEPGAFTSGRHFAGWIGLTPKTYSRGGKERLGKISKLGILAPRSLLVVGATAVLQHVGRGATISPWMIALLAADQDRREGGEPWSLCCFPRWPRSPSTATVPGDSAAYRGTTAAATTSASVRLEIVTHSCATEDCAKMPTKAARSGPRRYSGRSQCRSGRCLESGLSSNPENR
jgi:hypothetical protein